MNTGFLRTAVKTLNEGMKSVGREVNAEKVSDIVLEHAAITAAAAMGAGAITGVGGLIAIGVAGTSTATMYGRLANVMGVKLKTGLLKALATAIVADFSAAAALNIAASAAVSFIPGVGNMASGTLTGITNYCAVYLAGLIFIKMINTLGINRIEEMDENDIKAAAKEIQRGLNTRKIINEAKASYKTVK